MALVLGTNCGFVTTAPTSNPSSSTTPTDFQANAIRDTSPSDVIKITEIGWWCNNATQAANFEVGLYSDTGNDEPEVRLFVDNTNAKGTTGEVWKTVAVDWTISASTVYWIAFQLDNTATATIGSFSSFGGSGYSRHSLSDSSLPADWGTAQFTDTDGQLGVYALVETAAGTNTQINIGDAWKEIAGVQINIGDTWKTVEGMQINIGDAWKTIF